MKKKTYYSASELIENDKGWLFYNAALKNWKSIHSRIIGHKILDIGCGGGIAIGLSKIFEPEKKFIGFEGDKKNSKIWKLRNIEVKTGNIYKLPFKNDEFDTTYSSHVLEHLRYPKKAILESIRVTKKRIIHSVPCGDVGDKNFGSKHLHVFNRKTFIMLFNIKNIIVKNYYAVQDLHMTSLIVELEKKQ
jgi:ubiquinone/menaquinone biosynthesis C-methylase UbiE